MLVNFVDPINIGNCYAMPPTNDDDDDVHLIA